MPTRLSVPSATASTGLPNAAKQSLPSWAPIWRGAAEVVGAAHVAVDGEDEAAAREPPLGAIRGFAGAASSSSGSPAGSSGSSGSGAAVGAGSGVAAGSAPSRASALTEATTTVVPDAKPATARLSRTRSPSPPLLTVTVSPPPVNARSRGEVAALLAGHDEPGDRAAVVDAAVLRGRACA